VVSTKQGNFIKSGYEMLEVVKIYVLIIVVVQVGAVKIYLAAVETLRKKERQDETQFTTKIGGKLVWVPVISFCKIFIPSYVFRAYYAETDHSRPLIA